ncbi:protein kinase [Aggregicoccus sp. 17bor-14]|uniref:serine/threonine-protein kinase n=1 Tax=Myxococcaceae TaxID=31 RepID=UPI00351A3DDA
MLSPDTLVLDGRFRVLRPLGAGGMGEVYLAEQVSLGRKVAIKVLHRDLHVQPGMAERFRREARLLSAVEHPAVVRVIEYGESGDAPCLVMELVEGESLHHVLRGGSLPLARALAVLHQLAEGLAAIHEKGIVHRDLKPENVFLTRGPRGEQARLLDFGIARLVEGDVASNVSQVGVVLGTPEYLSPEQATGARVDARSDLYSFGVLAYRVLAGRLPFAGPSPRQFLAQHAAAPPLPLTEAAPALAAHPALVALVMRLLEKDPTQRPASALALGQALGAEAARLGVLPSITGGFALPPAPLASADAPGAFPRATALFGTVEPAAAGHAEAPPAAPAGVTALFGAAPPAATRSAAASTGALVGRTQNVALLLTDIQGYTERTSRQTREENARMLETHDRLLLPLVRSHGGRVVQKRGDALLAVFPSPTESVHCGMAIQDRLWRHNRAARAGDELHVRVCLHAGEVLLSRDGVLGEPVEIVTAVERVAEPGEVVFTEAVNLARNRAEAAAEPSGRIALPGGREEGLQLYRCVRAPEGLPFGGRDAYARSSALDVLRARAAHLGTHSLDVVRTGAAHLRRITLPGLRSGLKVLQLKSASGLRSGREALHRSGVGPVLRRLPARLGPGVRALPARLRHAGAGLSALPPRRRALLGLGLAALLLVPLLVVLHLRSPEVRARSELEKGQPLQALRTLDGMPGTRARTDGGLRQLRAQALHALGRHEDEHAVLSALPAEAREDVESRTLDGLAEDFAADEGDRTVRRLLSSFPERPVRKHLESLAEEPASERQWGALRYLEAQQATQGLDLVEVYAASLRSPNCGVRARAARRLSALGDSGALPELERLAALPKERGLLGGKNCGQDEAAEAAQALKRKSR